MLVVENDFISILLLVVLVQFIEGLSLSVGRIKPYLAFAARLFLMWRNDSGHEVGISFF